MFVNRADELSALRSWWERDRRPALVWGRRRVGKTVLVARFAAGLRTVFHTAAGRSAAGELAQLARQVTATVPTGRRDLLGRPYADWDDALEHLAELARDEPLLVVLDEFGDLVTHAPELPGVLRAFLDRPAEHKLRLLLCGSAVRHMEALQDHRAPLYGRFDLSLQLHPFRPHEAALMLGDLPPSDRALVYGILGGVPLYLSWWDQTVGVAANLARLVCHPSAPLLNEGQLVLATEAEHGEYPAAVLHAVAAGRTRHGQIKDQLRAEPARTLDRLVALRLLERVIPVTETGRTRRVGYRVADNFLAFYLHLVSRYRSEIERGLGVTILPTLQADLADFMGPRWEDMMRAHLRRLAATGGLGNEIVAIGPWWTENPDVEIDALALAGRSRTPVWAAEAKWAPTVDGRRLADRLRRKVAAIPGADPDTVRLALAARERVERAADDVMTITASDVLAAE